MRRPAFGGLALREEGTVGTAAMKGKGNKESPRHCAGMKPAPHALEVSCSNEGRPGDGVQKVSQFTTK